MFQSRRPGWGWRRGGESEAEIANDDGWNWRQTRRVDSPPYSYRDCRHARAGEPQSNWERLPLHQIGSQPEQHQVTGAGFEQERSVSGYGESIRDRLHLASPVDEMGVVNFDPPRDRCAPPEETIVIIAIVANQERDWNRVLPRIATSTPHPRLFSPCVGRRETVHDGHGRRGPRQNVLRGHEFRWSNGDECDQSQQAQRADHDATASSLARSCPQAASISSPRE